MPCVVVVDRFLDTYATAAGNDHISEERAKVIAQEFIANIGTFDDDEKVDVYVSSHDDPGAARLDHGSWRSCGVLVNDSAT